MKYKINWENIKNSYKGFESLAVKYVQMNYDSNFVHTGETRDGNKDAVLEKEIFTIILGYQSSPNASEEWWMEAKYSESKDVLPRYRLDATLVSAILKGNVGRIIFVTNMNIPSQTINDLRQAIIGVTVCSEVSFCTRNMLEYWLYQNTDLLSEYFLDYHNENIDLDELILINNIKYFNAQVMNYVFKENLRVLDIGETYIANFTVFSKNPQTVALKLDNSLQGIKIINPKKLILQNGINNIQFSFILKSNYGYRSNKKRQEHMHLPEPVFRLNMLQVVSECSVMVSSQIVENVSISSQKDMEKEIFDFFTKSNRNSGLHLFYLYGQSGVGKSRVLNNYMRYKKNFSCLCFYCEMSGDHQQDLKNLIDCINYIYFPFLPSDGITFEYLKQINNDNYFPPFYEELIAYQNNEIQINKLLVKYISESIALFPKKLFVNQRQIIVDNIHKATNTLINTMYKIVIELSMIHAPFQIIFSGQWIQHTSIYTKLSSIVNIKEKELCITVNDCLDLLPNQVTGIQLRGFLKSDQLFSNIIELLMFSIYLRDHDKNIHSFENFQIMYHLFFRENIMELYIKRLLDNAISNDVKVSQLCNQVFWNINGIPRTDTEEERKLLFYHVIKLDTTAQRVVPYHDLYAKYYRKNYIYNKLSDVPFAQLLEFGKYEDIKSAASKLHAEYIKKNYILVYYTLEPIFVNIPSPYRNMMDEITYFTLFEDFAHACSFCSIDYSGGRLFEELYNETHLLFNSAPQIQLISNAALWEIANSTFESLKYKQALELCQQLLEDTKRLTECSVMPGTPEDSVRYHNVNVIKSMIKSEMQETDSDLFFTSSEQKMIEHKQEERLWSFRIRYSLTLMQQDLQGALHLLKKCQKHYEKEGNCIEKYYLWSCFYISYLKMIIDKDPSSRYREETNAKSILFKMKDSFFNDYRKMLYGLVLYLYYRGHKDEADLYLSKDCYVLREKRPRLKGFEYLVLAFRHITEGENLSAINELKNAYTIFEHIPSYGNLIKHNINLIEADYQKTINQIEYYLGGVMDPNTYYLDIRGCW